MDGQQAALTRSASGRIWDRRFERLLRYVPWLLLVPAAVLSQLPGGQPWTDRAVTLGLAALAAAWVYLMHTRAGDQRRKRTGWMLVYFAGLLALFVALMARDVVFVLFTITGFFHAYQLRPWPVGVAGVFGTSVVLNTMTMFPLEPTAQWIGTYLGVITIQSAAISAGIVFSDKVAQHDAQREETLARLEAALEENAGLHAQLLTQAREAGVLDERQRMAREIHDTLAQGLTGIITQVQAAQRLWHSPEVARRHLDLALDLARDSLAEARRSVQALRPRQLEEARLPEALTDLTQRWATHTDADVTVEVAGEPLPLSPAIEVALFRFAQEALTNVARHARASRVGVTLSYLGDVVLLDVRDDGVGMNGRVTQGFGLNSMRQRIRSVGGTVDIESAQGEGTAVSASVPAITVEVAGDPAPDRR